MRRIAPVVSLAGVLLISAVFKLFAFAREAFITSHFGLSPVTDAYFSLQQFPLTLATFMFGAFALAFVPSYAGASQRGDGVRWIPGLLLYGTLLGLALTTGTLIVAGPLLAMFTKGANADTLSTLKFLALCYLPIVYTGIWAGICSSRGNSSLTTITTGLPYLVMTVVLMAMHIAHCVGPLSLPLSMMVGFGVVGVWSVVAVLVKERPVMDRLLLVAPWKAPEVAVFLRQLAASSAENTGYSVNWLLTLYFLAQAGDGAVSANNCAMRLALLGYSMLTLPAMQLLQARFAVLRHPAARARVFRQFLLGMLATTALLAATLVVLRYPVIQLVYMHGSFSPRERDLVAGLLPAWATYCVVLSLNGVVARYLYANTNGGRYTKSLLCAYTGTNVLRYASAGHVGLGGVIWCAVACEGVACLLNIVAGLRLFPSFKNGAQLPVLQGAQI